MKKQILIVVDVQNDFVTGTLGTKEAQEMLPVLLDKIRHFPGEVRLTKDTHKENYLQTQEGKILSIPHCIKGTEGWEFPKELEELQKAGKFKIYQKPSFGSVELAKDLKRDYEKQELESVELAGICTDICVISNALLIKAFLPEVPVYVDASCCAGVTPQKHQAALEVMKSCQVFVKNDE